MTSFSITVQWGAVECIHHNGDITGYLVRYGVQENENAQTMHVSGASAAKTTLSNLMSSTTYSIEVAAVNSAGTGVFSPIIMNMTQTSECCKAHTYWSTHMHTHSRYRGFIVTVIIRELL